MVAAAVALVTVALAALLAGREHQVRGTTVVPVLVAALAAAVKAPLAQPQALPERMALAAPAKPPRSPEPA
jgi:hypothetical protein